ncbi:MAG: cupredoxin domain-containing protein [Thermoleophilia bacterium]
MNPIRKLAFIMLAATLLLPATGCGDEEADSPLDTGVAEDGVAVVEMKDISFSPEEVTVKVDDTVRWVNRDPVAHTITDDGGRFDSGAVSGSATTYEQTYAEPGVFSYTCTIHPTMKGTVIVEE